MSDRPEPAIFDEFDILRRLADDRELVQDVLMAFAGDIGNHLDQMDRAIKDRDLLAIRRVAHKVKGAAANVSADALVAAARMIEAGADQGDWTAITERVMALVAGVDRYREVLRNRGWLPPPKERT
jgi:HPt (histidine-containing phosphotransfer) domain-containing protein